MIPHMFPLAFSLLVLCLASASSIPKARSRFTCGAHPPTNKQIEIHQRLSQAEAAQRLDSIVKCPELKINLYISIIAESRNDSSNISTEVIKQQVAVLNQSYKPAGISFTLKKTTRVYNATWAVGNEEFEMKQKLRQGDKRDLNLYFINTVPGGLGICSFPDELEYGDGLVYDGCMIDAATVPGGARAPYNKGKTVVHEVGHWFGLFHTFGNTCEDEGDLIADTPVSNGPSSGCPLGRDSCPNQLGLDPIHNYMDFSDDACYEEFTPGQIFRMHSMWNEFRAN